MKFAHIRVSEYFTFAKQIFHSEAISLARRANFVEKSTCLRKCFFLVGDGGFVTTSSLRSGARTADRVEREALPGPCIGGLTIDLAIKQKTTAFAVVFLLGGGWWIRTTEVSDNRFTVCPLWPLGKSPKYGAGERSRTINRLITNQVLCH